LGTAVVPSNAEGKEVGGLGLGTAVIRFRAAAKSAPPPSDVVFFGAIPLYFWLATGLYDAVEDRVAGAVEETVGARRSEEAGGLVAKQADAPGLRAKAIGWYACRVWLDTRGRLDGVERRIAWQGCHLGQGLEGLSVACLTRL